MRSEVENIYTQRIEKTKNIIIKLRTKGLEDRKKQNNYA